MVYLEIFLNGPVEVTLDENDPNYSTIPKHYPKGIDGMKLRVTTGTYPNEVLVGEQVISHALYGNNSFPITDANLLTALNNQPLGRTFNFSIQTNYKPGSFITGDELSSPIVSNQVIKMIPDCTVSNYTYNHTNGDGYVSQTFSSNSDAQISYTSSDPNILSIDPVSHRYNVPSLDRFLVQEELVETITISQASNSRYEALTTQETVITTQSTLTVIPLVRLSNGVIRYTGNPAAIQGPPLFFQVNLRGPGREWFAVVDNRHIPAIRNYAHGVDTTTFHPPDQTTPVPFNNIVTTLMTNMDNMFNNATQFNQPLNSWDVSRVRTMFSMFNNAEQFDQPLNSWDVSNVSNMALMFFNARQFNQPLNSWNVSNVGSMIQMFVGATRFNQPLNSWDVSRVVIAWFFSQGSALSESILPRFNPMIRMFGHI